MTWLGAAAPVAAAGTKVTTLGGARVEYADEGRGRTLLFFNGFGMDLHQWDGQAALLARQYRVVRFNPRGWGRSSAPASRVSPVEDAVALLDALHVDRVVAVGASVGGADALELAVSHPDRVTAMVLAGPTPEAYAWTDAYEHRLAGFTIATRGERVQRMLSDPYYVPAAQRDPALASRVRRNIGDNAKAFASRAALARAAGPPPFERLASIRAPTLVIVGSLEHPEVVRAADRIVEGLPAARRATLDGVGQMGHVERPDGFTLLVRIFLRDARLF